ncbi:uncharacterized protein LOC131663232 [Phymastichus coffea]|uniref:uncharacterized protein LOC131663232 n=1 Tax=Phymastichus coffea TaxID=108790 RepID=UPI00273CB961|nr:uncharacterized protein LOC131663232 [Phymastichus coffea]
MARDVRRLKSATLDRMGKMLRIHSKSSGEKSDEIPGAEASEDVSRKQKFNSLTRMLRLTDKEDNSKPLGQDRGRPLSRILRRKAPIEGDNPSDKAEDHMPGIFSRILGQFRGRIFKTDSLSKDEASKVAQQSNLSQRSPSDPMLSELNLETSSPVIPYEA